MHIVMTVNASWNIWNFRQPLVEALIADGHKVTVLAPADDTVPKLEAVGARCVDLKMNVKGMGALDNLSLVRTFRSHFKVLKPDIVLSYTIKNNIFGAIAARTLRIPYLPNITGLGTIFLGSKALSSIGKLLYRVGMGHLPVIFVQNDDDRQFLVERGIVKQKQIAMLPGSGIDLERFSATTLPNGSETIFLMISRLIRDKGIMEYLEAARSVRSEMPNCRFRLVGPLGSENVTAISPEELQPFIDDGSVEYLGPSDDVRPDIAASDCVVLPSYREGAPRSLIEGAAMGRPLVTTDVPGCRSVVEHGRNGFLCEVRSADSLAQSFRDFLDLSPKERQDMGDASREKMEREFDVKLVIDRYREQIARLSQA